MKLAHLINPDKLTRCSSGDHDDPAGGVMPFRPVIPAQPMMSYPEAPVTTWQVVTAAPM